MRCFDCSAPGERSEAIGVCHHCSVGLCADHGAIVSDPILAHESIAKVIALPKKARELLCRTCLDALRQRHAMPEEPAK